MWRDYCERYAKRAIKHNRLVCFGGVKLAALGRVSFDAIIHAAITSTDNKGHLELSTVLHKPIRLPTYCVSVRNFHAKYLGTKRFRGSRPLADAHGASIDDVIDDVT